MSRTTLFIIVLFLGFFGYGLYNNFEKKSAKSTRLACQKQTITFEKVSDVSSINQAKVLLVSNNYVINSHMEYSQLMQSNLKNHLNLKQANKLLKSIISSENSIQDSSDKLLINYYIYENDKKDKGKKNKKALEYAGYLVFEFILNKHLIYKIQTDYMSLDGKDIKARMQCAIDSFLSLKEK